MKCNIVLDNIRLVVPLVARGGAGSDWFSRRLLTRGAVVLFGAVMLAGCAFAHSNAVPPSPTLEATRVKCAAGGALGDDIRLKWTLKESEYPASEILYFEVLYRDQDSDPLGVFKTIAKVSRSDTGFNTSCKNDRTCVYRVVTIGRGGVRSPWSNYCRCDMESGRCEYDPGNNNDDAPRVSC